MTHGPLAAEQLFPFAATENNNIRIGIALGGGGALGAAHVGVLQELHSRGIRPSIVAGTSMGAIIGAGYAAGIPLSVLRKFAGEASISTFSRHIFGRKPQTALRRFPDGPALLNSDGLLHTVERLGGDRNIEDLPRKFAATATDVIGRNQIVITEGSVAEAIRASMAIPAVFPPIRRGRQLLYDGGLVENLPIRVAKSLGASHVIAVRIRPERPLRGMRSLAPHVGDLETDPTTLLVQPKLEGFSQWSAKHVDAMVEAGRLAAREAIAEITRHRVPVAQP
ncbi:patatin-like phospholipase family protein [Gulosibacter molinativorax]|uniref:patatin-like phospholipase family protein n=1 Tax=Gulosibacter molinativorax TaxID=256821 RepID=UPI000426123C|nr:patatin-like phospholipase family protein [Gulosibacter molinativorax]QUY63244.1 NTE family protein rssA [Gulosibacter molinativorax]